jgi:hypothetical protein|tara:strand:- start:1172 stop:1522 length:351 start_codon:yes stop_codon:yes gene_type:complete
MVRYRAMRKAITIMYSVLLILIPFSASAQIRVWGPAAGLTAPGAIANVTNMLVATGWYVCVAIFVAGAFFFIISMGQESRSGLGKGMMIGAVIGAVVISGARVILNTVMYFVYANY